MRCLKPSRLLPLLIGALLGWSASAAPPETEGRTADRERLVDELLGKIERGERDFLERFSGYSPLMELYLQTSEAPEAEANLGAGRDQYLMGRVSLDADGVQWKTFVASEAFQAAARGRLFASAKRGLLGGAKRRLLPRGFAQMIVPDAFEFNRAAYRFEYRRREFLGQVRTLVFDVRPNDDREGKFVGRIWVEDQAYRIVRLNGTYSRRKRSGLFFHFDSWRVHAGDDFWIPAYVYVQDEDDTGAVGTRFQAQARLWNYEPSRSNELDELTAILIEQEQAQDPDTGAEPTPLEAERQWRRQAQRNVTRRLERAGLVAPKGEVDQVLETVVSNLLAAAGSDLEIECRVLLTTPLETFSIGQTIVISRGLIDVLPDEASLAMALAGELGHITLGHRMDAMLGFSDVTLFDDSEILSRLRLDRSREETAAANQRALALLEASAYSDKLGNAGLFLKALERQAPRLPQLIRSNFGNGLASSDGLERLAALAAAAPKLEEASLEQIAALPLGSRVRLDPLSNRVALRAVKPVALRSADDKLPFAVTPFLIHLKRDQ